MTTIGKDIFTSWIMGMVLPGVLLNAAVMFTSPEVSVPEKTAVETTALSEAKGEDAAEYTVLLRDQLGQVSEGNLEQYLVGVVLAEMPASFEAEALKAQAVVARTYGRKAYETGGKHGDGSICMRSGCCQAYIQEADYLGQGGTQENLEKVKGAVADTAGYVLTYEDTLIEAVYFSSSGGRTEDAAAVWGTDFPYLQSVVSPGEENSAYHTDRVSFTPEAFQRLLGVTLPGSPESWFGSVSETDGGGVETMYIGGTAYPGTQLRSKLGLRSTDFAMEVSEGKIIVTTHGYGHRVGMSQYGADAMAVAGASFADILTHYYPGTELHLLETIEE